jgi:hypothetical protein
LALANTAILMRLIEELIDCGAIARPTALLQNAVSDLQGCPERSARVDDRADPQGIDAATLAAGAD